MERELALHDLERSLDYDAESLMVRVKLLEARDLVMTVQGEHAEDEHVWNDETYICAPFKFITARNLPDDWHIMPAGALTKDTVKIDIEQELRILGRFIDGRRAATVQ